ncbi:DUF6282 family protein [Lentibacillus sp. N15]|uniref:DUF6282 family protein n=1 Tax=Lentibacillus songyuanensis TaxID=3136161 RepID=UPI0031BA9C3A
MAYPFHPLLEGAYDFHVHSAPSIFERKQNDWEVTADAIQANMGGLVLKSHESSTAERAYLIQEKEPSLHVVGGIVLNSYVGGLNPYAVEATLKMGGKVVWFPTLSSIQHQHYFAGKKTKLYSGESQPSNETVNIKENGKIKDDVHQILSLIKEYDAVLATGHLSLQDTYLLVEAAISIGIEKIIIQHADMGIAKIPLKDQEYFASKGCMIEKCFLACSPDFKDLTVAEMVRTIHQLGAKSCILGTDYGQPHNEPPVHAFNRFVEQLEANGVSEKDMICMIKENPTHLLNVR